MASKRNRGNDADDEEEQTPRKIRRSTGRRAEIDVQDTPSWRKSALKGTPSKPNGTLDLQDPTPGSVKRVLFSTPHTAAAADQENADGTPTAARNDRSARKKSARAVQMRMDDSDEEENEDEVALAQEILDEDEAGNGFEDVDVDTLATEATAADTPSKPEKRPRGRPKGKRRERTPSPPAADMPSHELYFFQNRTGANKTSSNTLPANILLNHDDYREQIQNWKDPHKEDIERLKTFHKRAFDQWVFEVEEGFNLCFYGYGSKRELVMEFVEHMYFQMDKPPKMVVVNGYAPGLTMRDILSMLASQIFPKNIKLPAQPNAMLEMILDALSEQTQRQSTRLILMIHSLDHVNLRKSQQLIARLASHDQISLLATCDTPNFPLLWDLNLTQQLHFLYHDATTFEPYTAELDVVDDVNTLLGRSGRRLGGKDGVAYVLKSLPENARSLFRILVAEQLALADAGMDVMAGAPMDDSDNDDLIGAENEEDAVDMQDTPSRRVRGRGRPAKKAKPKPVPVPAQAEVGVEFRTLYHKAVEEFVCSSELNFRTLLKEFHDHQMIESRKDGMGTERLVVPFRREELETLLEDLV